MEILINNVAVLLIFALIGWILGKRQILSTQNLRLLSVLEVWVFMPCNCFNSFSKNFTAEYFIGNYPLLILSAIILLGLVLVNYLVVPKLVQNHYHRNVVRSLLTIPNYGYVGYALVQGTYGDLMLFNAQFFALPMAIYSYTEGYRLLTNSGKPSFRRIVNPIIIAILVGCIFGLAQWKVPMAVSMVILKGAACMGPVSMLLAGITISM
mgnify:CR=1 FL=1